MRAGDLLRRVDGRALPSLGEGLHRLRRGAFRLRVPLLAGLSVLVALLAAVWAAGDGSPVGDDTVGDVARVGVSQGQSIPAYVLDSRAELDRLAADPRAGEVYALVTLAAYLAPDRVAPIVGGAAVSAVYVRVPLPRTQTEIIRIDAFRVPEDVLAGMESEALRKDGEALDYRDLSARLTGAGAQERRLRAVYDSGARVAEAEAEAYRRRCSCVYAAIVRATPAALVEVARRPGVRAVDAAPEVRRLDRAVFLPPLPEQADVARPPADSSLPASGIATGR
ncbi:MAG TPA: hypothetical protein VFT95_23790 [Micromonosporaceae bacterium]|nr:hypothetical protein [Micromonosporaceae bacterium]